VCSAGKVEVKEQRLDSGEEIKQDEQNTVHVTTVLPSKVQRKPVFMDMCMSGLVSKEKKMRSKEHTGVSIG